MSFSASVAHRCTGSIPDDARLSRFGGQSEYREISIDGMSHSSDRNRHNNGGAAIRSENATNDTECAFICGLPVLQNCTCCIATDVKNRWTNSGYAALKAIDCVWIDGALVIRGSVSSYYYKQMAQELVRGLEGVRQVVNKLTVPM